jgi:8-oxo-dGDP phosphatase
MSNIAMHHDPKDTKTPPERVRKGIIDLQVVGNHEEVRHGYDRTFDGSAGNPSNIKSHRWPDFAFFLKVCQVVVKAVQPDAASMSKSADPLQKPFDHGTICHMKPTVHSSQIVHENPWYRVRHDVLTWPNGQPGNYFVTELPDCCSIIAIHEEKVLTVTLHRHAIDQISIELPMGGLLKDETPEQGAHRELREETGYQANIIEHLGYLYQANGVLRDKLHVFLAKNLNPGQTELEDAEQGMTTNWIPIEEWRALIAAGHITDGDSLASWALYEAKNR